MSKKSKHFVNWLIILTLISVSILAACQPAAPAAPTTEAPAAEKKYNIGVSIQGANNDWASASYAHFRYGFEQNKDKIENIYYAECGYDPQKQLADVEDLLTKNLDAIIIQPVSETALVSVFEKAKDMGVKVVMYSGPAATQAYDTYIDRDHKITGEKYAQFVADRIGGKGNVVVIMGYPGSGYSNAVLAGVDSVLAKYPDIKNLGVEYAEYTPAKSKQIIEAYFAKGVEINGVIVDGGLMGFGVLEAFNDSGRTIPPMTCDDTFLFLKKAVELNFTDYLCASSGQELSYDAALKIFDVLEGKPVEKDYVTAPQTITGEEVIKTIDPNLPNSYWLFSKTPAERIAEFFK